MNTCRATTGRRLRVAFGPAMPGWGSWEWIGLDLLRELSGCFETCSFPPGALPNCDVLVIVKHFPGKEWLERACRQARVIYAPVDYYHAAAAIDADGPSLRHCARVVVHCERLRRYFAPYAPVDYLDHHVKFLAPLRRAYPPDGEFLWVGVRTNLPDLVEWLNAHPVPGRLCLLTNLERPSCPPRPSDLGLRRNDEVRLEHWSAPRQRQLMQAARAALDIKGADFRARHKPPAKALDFLSSGLSLAMNPESSPVEHLARLGFETASPLDADRWLSRAYWEECQRFGAALRELLSLPRVARRWYRLITETATN